METTQVSSDRGLNKEDVAHTFYGILLMHEKGWNDSICDYTNGPWEYYAKQNKSQKN